MPEKPFGRSIISSNLEGRLHSITLHQLWIFANVVRCGGLSKATEILLLTEPAISNQIKMLESVVGTRLLKRVPGGRKVETTEAGAILLQICDDIFHRLELGLRAIDALHDVSKSDISIGTGANFASYIFPKLYETFRRDNPSIIVHVKIDRRQSIIEALKQRRLDLAVLGSHVDEPSLQCEELGYYSKVVLVGPPGHRLANTMAAPFKELSSESLILHDFSSTIAMMLKHLAAKAGVVLPIALEITNVEALIRVVANNLAIAPICLEVAAPYIADGRIVPLQVEGFPLRLEWMVIYPRFQITSAAWQLKEHLMRYKVGESNKRLGHID